MKAYEPGWISSQAPASTSSMKVPLPAPVTIGQAMPACLEQPLGVLTCCAASLDHGVALFHAADVLRAAVVGVQPGEAQILGLDDLARQRDGRLARRDAAAAHADFELDVDVELRPGAAMSRTFSALSTHTPILRAARQRGEALELRRADDLVASPARP